MRFIECLQGSPEWDAARCGLITASCFADAVSTVGGLTEQQAQYVDFVLSSMSLKDAAAAAGYKALPTSDIVRRALLGERTEEFSDTAKRYAADLSIERISEQPHGEPVKTWVLERGHTMEAAARRIYEGRTGAFVTEAGICLTDDNIFGYSTDGLVDDDGLIEIKAPIDSIKIAAMWRTGDTSEYDHQMQGGMWITGRKWCDFIMYVPDLAPVGKDLFVKRVFRDDGFIDTMVEQLGAFDKLVAANVAIFRSAGEPVYFGQEAGTPQDDVVGASWDPDFQEVAPAPVTELNPVLAVIGDALQRKRAAQAELATAQTSPEGAELSPAAQALNEEQGAANFAARHPALAASAKQADVARAEVKSGAPTLRLGQINERLAPLSISADGLRSLGFEPAGRDKAAVLYHEFSFPHICAALMRHIAEVRQQCEKEAV